MQYLNFGQPKIGAQIVDLITAKANSRIEFNDEDDLLQLFVDAATDEIENYISAPVLEREAVILENNSWTDTVPIPFQINELLSVQWLDTAGAATNINEEDYDLFASELNIGIEKPEDFHRLKITATAGYPNEEIPNDIKRAALLIFSHYDTYRENMPIKLNTSARALLRPYRNY